MYDNIKLKRIYDEPEQDDGVRLLADRLWPRGISKAALNYDDWIKALCPSNQLRQAWHKGNLSREQFVAKYLHEIEQQQTAINIIACQALKGPLTLLSAVKDIEGSHLPVLKKAILTAMEELECHHNDSRSSPVCYQED